MSQLLPGVPRIVVQAQVLVAHDLGLRWRRVLRASLGLAVVLALLALVVDRGLLGIVIAPAWLFLVVGGCLAVPVLPAGQVEDAQRLLQKWEEQRDAWAEQAIRDGLEEGREDVASWSAATRRLSGIQSRS
ncbi:MAG: hypothetical protein H6736_07950 [Alphaproteobacteria bacterium]|nr:hypothetical protein [Alphaproteobacteria bacterium]MCB9691731.1 hypothetical protein [Alphaproteobacteria bacterium]